MDLQLDIASRGSRFWANFIDNFVFGFIVFAFQNAAQPVPGLVFLGYMVVQIVLLSKDGQTIGKKMMNIKIVKTKTGMNGGFITNVFLRSLLYGPLTAFLFAILFTLLNIFYRTPILIYLFYFGMWVYLLLGIIDVLMIFQKSRRCLHDDIAGTSVVVASPKQQTTFSQREKAPLASLGNLESFVGENAYNPENQHYIGKIAAINSEQGICAIKTDWGGEIERGIDDVLVLEQEETVS